MDLKLPLIISRQGGRLMSCWLPHWPLVRKEGVSLSELKDDLALMVMESFERVPPSRAWRYQMAPHLRLEHIAVDTVARDREDGRAYTLKGRIAVLLEKWPGDAFWVATPTRIHGVAFALESPEDLPKALAARLSEHCLEKRIETLAEWHAERNERLDLLEVDSDAPTILPRGQLRQLARKPPGPAKAKGAATAPVETEEEREQRRARARLSVRTLREIGKNLTHQARDGSLEPAYGREGIVSALLDAIDRREGAAVVLVGPSGVGKTAILHEVTRRLVERQRISATRRDVWRIDGNQFIAGMSYVGQWEARARELCTELIDTGDVLFVDDLASLVYAGRHSKGDTHAAQYLEPHLGRSELTVIAESTPERFERVREEAPSFAALFDVVQIPAVTKLETLPMMLGTVRGLEADDGGTSVRIAPDAMELVLELSERFFAHQALPGRAVRLLQRVLAGPGTVEGHTRRYRAADVFAAVRRETGLPDFILGGAAPKTRAEIVADLTAQVAGQPEAIDAVTDAVLALQLSVQDPEKPLANHLFVGPTGVGKTETAKALARYLFGSADRLVRFDMSELSNANAIARLIGEPGAPDGELITALRAQPFCVILLDEVEKAHPRAFDALLQLLGEGRLTDAHGHTADGRNSVVVMTSNLGVREAASQTGFLRADTEGAAQHYISAARAFFRPELFNRLDRVVPFRSLDKKALRKVVEHALAELLSRRGVRRSNVLVDVEPELLELLVEQAYDPRYGARPLKRALEKRLAVPLAHHLLRRDANDLAVVELLRQGDDLQLAVRVLAPVAHVPLTQWKDWTLPMLSGAAVESAERIAMLLASAPAKKLLQVRRAALAARTPLPVATAILDRLELLGSRIEELIEGTLDASAYDEEERAPAKPKSSRERFRGGFEKARFGLRPRAGFEGVVYAVNSEAIIKSSAPVLITALDELELLADQLRASSSGDETATLVLEPVGPPSQESIFVCASSLPPLGQLPVYDHGSGWTDAGAGPGPRLAYVFHGSGVAQQLEPWLGYAQVDVLGADGAARRTLVRAVLLEGGDGTVEQALPVLRAYDVQAKAEREARRAGELLVDRHPRLVLERLGTSGPGRFVATGLDATTPLQHLAACLRAKEGAR
jgi:ATP-dependent Clp protease ATP-binding subunit ClpC